MNSGQWIVDVESEITVVSNESVNFIAQYTLADRSSYSQIPGSFTKNGNRYYIPFTFTVPGVYMIRIIDVNGNINESYARINVNEKTVMNSLVSIEDKVDTKPSLLDIESSIVLANTSQIDSLSSLIAALPLIQNIRDEFINVQYGALEIKNNQMTIWDKAGEIIAVFSLFDANDNPTMSAVYKREVL
jgi:hypothetical protein